MGSVKRVFEDGYSTKKGTPVEKSDRKGGGGDTRGGEKRKAPRRGGRRPFSHLDPGPWGVGGCTGCGAGEVEGG